MKPRTPIAHRGAAIEIAAEASTEVLVCPPQVPLNFEPGDKVTVCAIDRQVQTGIVDTVDCRGEVMWIHMDNGLGRQMFHHQDRVTILPGTRDTSHCGEKHHIS